MSQTRHCKHSEKCHRHVIVNTVKKVTNTSLQTLWKGQRHVIAYTVKKVRHITADPVCCLDCEEKRHRETSGAVTMQRDITLSLLLWINMTRLWTVSESENLRAQELCENRGVNWSFGADSIYSISPYGATIQATPEPLFTPQSLALK